MKLIVGVFLLASLAAAQGTDAVLTGSVLDSTGAVVPQASVMALNMNTGVATRQTSNASGVYLFPALPPGDYTITAEKVCAYSVAVIGSFLIVAGLVWAMYHFTRPEPLGEDRAAFRRKTLAEVRNADAEVLNNPNYVWQDQSKGIVRLPLTNAMELALRLWQDPAAARSSLNARAEKAFYIPPPPPPPPNKFD